MDAAFKAVVEYGITVVALVVVAGFLAWLIRDYIKDLKQQRDVASTGWQGATTAVEKLTDAIREDRLARAK